MPALRNTRYTCGGRIASVTPAARTYIDDAVPPGHYCDPSDTVSDGARSPLASYPTALGDLAPRSARHSATCPPGHVRRPRNAFIAFRSAMVASGRFGGDNKQISRTAGQMWGALSDAEKAPWRRVAQAEREEHARAYPNYKYTPGAAAKAPRKRKSSGRCKPRRASRRDDTPEPPPLPIVDRDGTEGRTPTPFDLEDMQLVYPPTPSESPVELQDSVRQPTPPFDLPLVKTEEPATPELVSDWSPSGREESVCVAYDEISVLDLYAEHEEYAVLSPLVMKTEPFADDVALVFHMPDYGSCGSQALYQPHSLPNFASSSSSLARWADDGPLSPPAGMGIADGVRGLVASSSSLEQWAYAGPVSPTIGDGDLALSFRGLDMRVCSEKMVKQEPEEGILTWPADTDAPLNGEYAEWNDWMVEWVA